MPDAAYALLAAAGGTLTDTTASADAGYAHIDSSPLLAEGLAVEIKVTQNAAANLFEILQVEIHSMTSAQLL